LQSSGSLKGQFFTGEKSLGIENVKKYGKGRGVLLNLVVGQYHFITLGGTGGEISKATSGDAKLQLTLRRLLRKHLTDAGVKCEVSVKDARNAEFPCLAAMRYDGANKVLFIHQSGSEGERFNFKNAVPVTVKLAQKGHIYDVREGKYLGHTDTFKSALVPAWSKVYSIQQKQVKGVALKVKGEVSQGTVFPVEFTAVNAAGPQVFHAELLDPAGESDPVALRNYHTDSASGKCQMQIPFNGAKGTWKVLITHVNTGMKAISHIKVK
jgi:hypothetical protein